MSSKQTKKRLYRCEECKATRWVHWVELNRAARPRCNGCGSARLELVSDEAKKDAIRLQRERVVGTGGSLKLATQEADTPHRKVT